MSHRRLFMQSLLVMLAALASGCTWGPVYVLGETLEWSPDRQRILTETPYGFMLADMHGNATCIATWSDLTEPGQREDATRYRVRTAWMDSDTVVIVQRLYTPQASKPETKLTFICAHDATVQRERTVAIPDPPVELAEHWISAYIIDVLPNGLAIGIGNTSDSSTPFVLDIHTEEFAAITGFDGSVSCVQTETNDSGGATLLAFTHVAGEGYAYTRPIQLTRFDIDRDPLTIHPSQRCGATQWDSSPSDFHVRRGADGRLRLSRFYHRWHNGEYIVDARFVQYVYDEAADEMSAERDITFQKSGMPRFGFRTNPSGTRAAFFGETGELVILSLVDQSKRSIRHDNPKRIKHGYDDVPIDGRGLDPIWLDNDHVMTLWPSEATRTQMEFVVWNVAGEAITSNCISENWPEDLRPDFMRLRLGLWWFVL